MAVEILVNQQRVLLVVPELVSADNHEQKRSNIARREEFAGLARAINLHIINIIEFIIKQAKSATLIGTGKLEEIKDIIKHQQADLLIIDHALTPIQQRNLERYLNIKVLDRTALILEIFGARAQTREGSLQVELAHLTYQKGRLVRSWTHLERQRGGAGFLGGPGETQIESDRRMLQKKIIRLQNDIEKIKRTRKLQRRKRQRAPHSTVALVGYTNAGKSTLFNTLTQSNIFAQDLLFATLDPTTRKLLLPGGNKVMLTDTVGFISNLPTGLIAAFRATLEEITEADLILHIRDISHPQSEQQAEDVYDVLAELGIEPQKGEQKILEVWNKSDQLDTDAKAYFENKSQNQKIPALLVSAIDGENLPQLAGHIEAHIFGEEKLLNLTIPSSNGALLAWLYRNSRIISQQNIATEINLKLAIAKNKVDDLYQHLKMQ